MKKIIVIGGGLAGLTSSILLARTGFDVTLIEKKQYPFHRVCGEYVSNEVLPFLRSLNINIEEFQPSYINKLVISSVAGKTVKHKLDSGGFGISRYVFDEVIYQAALREGVNFIIGEKATDVVFNHNQFEITLADNRKLIAGLAIAAYGKRSNLDQKLSRSFFYKRSPYMGVKYHIRTDFPPDVIQLDNFEGGYCGIEKIEAGKYCLCYLAENRLLKQHGSVRALENNVLYKNPRLKQHFTEAEFLFDKPETINEISFEQKSLVENHMLFCGDAAGMITPLCGNGMAMAIHSAKLLAGLIAEYSDFSNPRERKLLEEAWQITWQKQFAFRLNAGRRIQQLFGSPVVSDIAVSALKHIPYLADFLIKKTHGKPF